MIGPAREVTGVGTPLLLGRMIGRSGRGMLNGAKNGTMLEKKEVRGVDGVIAASVVDKEMMINPLARWSRLENSALLA